MSKTFERADNDVLEAIDMAKNRWHPVIVACEVRFDVLFCAEYLEADEGEMELMPALEVGGYPAAACVRITSLKDRAKGLAHAELTVDKDWWERHTSRDERLALIDHELAHVQVKAERGIVTWDPIEKKLIGEPLLDDTGGPKLKLRKHDWQHGGFHDVARRHGDHAVEVRAVKALQVPSGQWAWDFDAPRDSGVALAVGGFRAAGATLQ